MKALIFKWLFSKTHVSKDLYQKSILELAERGNEINAASEIIRYVNSKADRLSPEQIKAEMERLLRALGFIFIRKPERFKPTQRAE